MPVLAPVSVIDLARQLPALMEQHDTLDEQSIPFAAGTPEYFTLCRAMDGVLARIYATEDMILATPAVTLADAAGQLLMAAAKVRHAMQIQDPNETLARVERALHGVMCLVAAAAGMDLGDLGVEYLAPYVVQPVAVGAVA
ncbi:MAG: hypothetical protein ACRYHQ_24795 [Janthinobacterium lividum]